MGFLHTAGRLFSPPTSFFEVISIEEGVGGGFSLTEEGGFTAVICFSGITCLLYATAPPQEEAASSSHITYVKTTAVTAALAFFASFDLHKPLAGWSAPRAAIWHRRHEPDAPLGWVPSRRCHNSHTSAGWVPLQKKHTSLQVNVLARQHGEKQRRLLALLHRPHKNGWCKKAMESTEHGGRGAPCKCTASWPPVGDWRPNGPRGGQCASSTDERGNHHRTPVRAAAVCRDARATHNVHAQTAGRARGCVFTRPAGWWTRSG